MTTLGSMGVIVWERLNDRGRWQPYEARVSDYIETSASTLLPPPTIQLGNIDPSFGSAVIDLAAMRHLDSIRGPGHPIRQQIYSAEGPAGLGIIWQWSGDRPGEWHPYDFDVATILEAAWSNGSLDVDLRRHQCQLPYVVKLKSMLQMRVETGFTRGIRRLTSGCRYTHIVGLSVPVLAGSLGVGGLQPYRVPATAGIGFPFPSVYSSTSGSGGNGVVGGVTTFTGQQPYQSSISVPPRAHMSFGSAPLMLLPPANASAGFTNGNSHMCLGLGPAAPLSTSTKAAQKLNTAITTNVTAAAAAAINGTASKRKTRSATHTPAKKLRSSESNSSAVVSNTDNRETLLNSYFSRVSDPPKDEDCAICCENLTSASGYDSDNADPSVIQLKKCRHHFHHSCLFAMYNSGTKDGSLQCPTCKAIYGVKCGNCPAGRMSHCVMPGHLAGYGNCSIIRIMYMIASGVQGPEHPHPGKKYTARGFPRDGFLPNNAQGQKVLKLLYKAWDRRLTFTIGTSVTTGETDTVVWNEIHHKTEITNQSGHGYPDANYLDNVTAELAVHGITEED